MREREGERAREREKGEDERTRERRKAATGGKTLVVFSPLTQQQKLLHSLSETIKSPSQSTQRQHRHRRRPPGPWGRQRRGRLRRRLVPGPPGPLLVRRPADHQAPGEARGRPHGGPAAVAARRRRPRARGHDRPRDARDRHRRVLDVRGGRRRRRRRRQEKRQRRAGLGRRAGPLPPRRGHRRRLRRRAVLLGADLHARGGARVPRLRRLPRGGQRALCPNGPQHLWPRGRQEGPGVPALRRRAQEAPRRDLAPRRHQRAAPGGPVDGQVAIFEVCVQDRARRRLHLGQRVECRRSDRVGDPRRFRGVLPRGGRDGAG